MGTTLRRCSKSVAGVGSPAPLIGCRTPTVKCTTPPSCTYLGRLPSQLLKVVASDRCASHAVCVCYLVKMAWDSIEQSGERARERNVCVTAECAERIVQDHCGRRSFAGSLDTVMRPRLKV